MIEYIQHCMGLFLDWCIGFASWLVLTGFICLFWFIGGYIREEVKKGRDRKYY